MEVIQKINDYYKHSRMGQILHDYFFIITILSIIVSGVEISWKLIPYFITTLLVHSFAFCINDCEDAEDDAKDPKRAQRRVNLISAKIISYKNGVLFAFGMALVAIFIAAVFSNFWGTFYITTGLIVGFFYSWKKVRLKSVQIIDIVSHQYMLGIFNVLFYYSVANTVITPGAWSFMLGIGMFSMAGDLHNEIRDFETDVKANLKNTAILIGKKNAIIINTILYPLAIALITWGILYRFL